MFQDHGKHRQEFQNTNANTKYAPRSWKTWTPISKYEYKICSRIMDNNFKIQIQIMFQNLGEHGEQIQGRCSRVGSSCYWPSCGEKKKLFLSSDEKMSWFFRCLRLSWTSGTARWSLRTLLQTGWAGLSCLPSITLVFFVGFRFIALLKDCVLTSWQVYCQVGQLWQSKQLNQVEHGLWQYGVNRWSFPFLN